VFRGLTIGVECCHRGVGKVHRFLHRGVDSDTVRKVGTVCGVQLRPQGGRIGVRPDGFGDLDGVLDERQACNVLFTEQLGFQPIGRVVLPVLDTGLVLALQATDFRLHHVRRQGAFHSL
jgi:hypothetical protein